MPCRRADRKSTRLNSSHTVIYPLSLHDALPIYRRSILAGAGIAGVASIIPPEVLAQSQSSGNAVSESRSEEHTSELQSHSDLPSFPTRRSSDLPPFDISRGRDRRRRLDHPARSARPVAELGQCRVGE